MIDDQGSDLKEIDDVKVVVPNDHLQVEKEIENEKECYGGRRSCGQG